MMEPVAIHVVFESLPEGCGRRISTQQVICPREYDFPMSEEVPKPRPVIPTAVRSRMMAAVKRVDTKPEISLRSSLHRRGLRFRKDFPIRLSSKSIRPDVVFTRQKVAVFVDGCFWHGCPQHCRRPKTNIEFWSRKLEQNQERDRRQNEALRQAGWVVLRIWEHESLSSSVDKVVQVIGA